MKKHGYDFETEEQKEEAIRDWYDDRDEYVCTVCGEKHATLQDAVDCCWEDCREQALAYFQERKEYLTSGR